MVDAQGPLRVTWLEGSYAFGFNVGAAAKLRIGASAGIKQFTLDGTQLNPAEQGDNVIPQSVVGTAVPALSTGVYLTGDYAGGDPELRYFVGFSIQNLLEPSIEGITLNPNGNGQTSVDARNFILSGGYNFQLDTRMRLMPSVTLMMDGVLVPQASFGVLWSYNPVSVGVNYRWFGESNLESVGMQLGVNVNANLTVSYAYEYPLLNLNTNGNINSHEFILTYLIKSNGNRSLNKQDDLLKDADQNGL